MQRRGKLVAAGIAAVVLLAGGTGSAIALAGGGGDDGDVQATGGGAERARDAALAITRGGHANAVERDGEDGATWEVEVTRPDGVTVDVRLDESYKLVVVERDSEGG